MNAANFAYYILGYNFVVCVLLMLASEKIGHYAPVPFGRYRSAAARYTRLSVFTFGAVWAVLMASVFIVVEAAIFFSS